MYVYEFIPPTESTRLALLEKILDFEENNFRSFGFVYVQLSYYLTSIKIWYDRGP